ncbi:hypothetical protein SAMN05421692_1774 [Chryseobacterium indologenes]|nr:hypothetical protein SAMN05421692_1774 [Chryseobacterium indologenes]SUX53092.1 Uncharacterised protein [Chryseobacterium indologenes]
MDKISFGECGAFYFYRGDELFFYGQFSVNFQVLAKAEWLTEK